MRKTNSGFTLIELLIYVAIFAMVAGFFTSILLISLRVQGTQSGLVDISSQLSFAMQTIQRHIQESNSISSPASGVSANSLTLVKPTGNVTIAFGSCGGVMDAICVTEAGSPNPLTTTKAVIKTLSFTHYTTPSNNPITPGVDTIQISITASNNTQDPASLTTRTLQGSASPLNQ